MNKNTYSSPIPKGIIMFSKKKKKKKITLFSNPYANPQQTAEHPW
jgi:hypothetical protein